MNQFIGKANQIPKGIRNACSVQLVFIPEGNWVVLQMLKKLPILQQLWLLFIPEGNWVVLPSNSFGGIPTPLYQIILLILTIRAMLELQIVIIKKPYQNW